MIKACRATFVEAQDCRLAQDFIKKANDLGVVNGIVSLGKSIQVHSSSIMKKRRVMMTLAESIKEVYTNITKQH
jgi:hypothetical protein